MRATGRVGGMRLGGLGRGRARRYEGRIGRTGRLGGMRAMGLWGGRGGCGRMGGTDESEAKEWRDLPGLLLPYAAGG